MRKIGQDDNGENVGDKDHGMLAALLLDRNFSDNELVSRLTASLESSPVVVRPPISSRSSSKAKKRSSLRTSFGPAGTSMLEDDDDNTSSAVFTPKRTTLSRQAVEKNALRKSLAANLSADHLPIRRSEERPTYNAEILKELKTSTPSTPKDLSSHSDNQSETSTTIDLASKFGSDLSVYDTGSAIPTDAEIREKKERRARLAKEQDFISLDADSDDDHRPRSPASDDSNDERSLQPYAFEKSSRKDETRLVRDDEDFAEGFDEFVSDGRIALGRKAEREQRERQEAEMRDMINEAEGGNNGSGDEDDESSDASEAERKAA